MKCMLVLQLQVFLSNVISTKTNFQATQRIKGNRPGCHVQKHHDKKKSLSQVPPLPPLLQLLGYSSSKFVPTRVVACRPTDQRKPSIAWHQDLGLSVLPWQTPGSGRGRKETDGAMVTLNMNEYGTNMAQHGTNTAQHWHNMVQHGTTWHNIGTWSRLCHYLFIQASQLGTLVIHLVLSTHPALPSTCFRPLHSACHLKKKVFCNWTQRPINKPEKKWKKQTSKDKGFKCKEVPLQKFGVFVFDKWYLSSIPICKTHPFRKMSRGDSPRKMVLEKNPWCFCTVNSIILEHQKIREPN